MVGVRGGGGGLPCDGSASCPGKKNYSQSPHEIRDKRWHDGLFGKDGKLSGNVALALFLTTLLTESSGRVSPQKELRPNSTTHISLS